MISSSVVTVHTPYSWMTIGCMLSVTFFQLAPTVSKGGIYAGFSRYRKCQDSAYHIFLNDNNYLKKIS